MKRIFRVLVVFALVVGWVCPSWAASGPVIKVASKTFTESVIFGEILTLLARSTGAEVEHVRNLGANRAVWNAIRSGEIDAYLDYTGTIRFENFAGRQLSSDAELRAAVEAEGLVMHQPLGFDNAWRIGMRESDAARYGITKISDLAKYPDFAIGLTPELINRADGWPGLRQLYKLPQENVRAMNHELALRALDGGSLAVTDVYGTDAEILAYHMRLLDDDQHYFPSYEGVVLRRKDLSERALGVVAAWERLSGTITTDQMRALNARARVEKVPESEVAAKFLADSLGVTVKVESSNRWKLLARYTREHLLLVIVSLFMATLVAVPLGVLAAKKPRIGRVVLGVTSVVQTIPSLALLVLMIPLLGIGAVPAMAALFCYSLLPIVRNTSMGLSTLPAELRESAEALGLPARARLFRIELPLASPSILAGIKTAAVINVGNATLGALVGAGGYGQPILTGIRMASTELILLGAVPAALLALLVSGLFDSSERWLVPEGLRVNG